MEPPPIPIKEVPVSSTGQTLIAKACEKHWNAHKDNCSGFVKAVAAEIGIFLPDKQANEIIDYISPWAMASWWKIGSPKDAGLLAEEGYFVLACLESKQITLPSGNGHVAVVTSGYRAGKGNSPRGYWGAHKSVGKKNATMNYSFSTADIHKVTYYRCMWKR